MLKKLGVSFLIILILAPSISAFASAMNRDWGLPLGHENYQKVYFIEVYSSFGVKNVDIIYHDQKVDGHWQEKDRKKLAVKENDYDQFTLTCLGYYHFNFLDAQDNVTDSFGVIMTNTHLNGELCTDTNFVVPGIWEGSGSAPTPGDGTGGDDGTGGTDPGDGTGGDDGTGGTDPGDGTGGDDGTGGTDPGDGTGGSCGCIFNTPGWQEYMDKIDEIIGKIPHWDSIADKFRDSIVPRVINDLEDLLGRAPNTPTPPPKPGGVDDRGINDKKPGMQDNPDLKDISDDITPGNIKDQAPKIPVRDDPTGGFDLITDPVGSLPEVPSETPMKPGETDPGEWGENKPNMPDNPYPNPPEDPGDISIEDPPRPGTDTGSAPTPGDNTGDPPTPGGDTGTAPTPGTDPGNAPTPGGGGDSWFKNYKRSPDDPDGSGTEVPLP